MTRSLTCSIPGCNRRWVSSCGRLLCSVHLHAGPRAKPQGPMRQAAPLGALPLREAVRPFIEPVERDEQPEF